MTAAADFESLLVAAAGRVAVGDLKEVLRDGVDHRGAQAAAVAWLVDVIGATVFVEAANKAGALGRADHELRVALAGPERDRIAGIIGCKNCAKSGQVGNLNGVSECEYCAGTGINAEATIGEIFADDTIEDPAILVRWLIEQGAADAMVAGLVEAGVLVRPMMVTPDSDDHPVSDGRYVMPEAMSTWDDHGMAGHDWRPLYRIGENHA